jgi:hypothetical protein
MTHRKTSIKVSQILLHQKKNFSSDKSVVYTCEKNEIIGRFLKLIKKKKKKRNKGEERIFNEVKFQFIFENKKLQNKFTLSDNNSCNFLKDYYLLYSCFPTGSWQSLTTFKNQ